MNDGTTQTLERAVNAAKASYAKRGQGADSWQWRDEGLPYAIGDYLSSFELTQADWAYARANGLEDEVNWWLNQGEEGR